MNKLQAILIFALIVLVSVSMVAQHKIKEHSMQLPEESFIDNTVYQIPELIKQPSIVFSKTSSLTGVKIGSTDYDYGFNSGATQSLVTWGDGTRAHLTFMERDLTQTAPANRRCQTYVYVVGSTIKTAYPVPKATAASGFGGIDVFNSANLKNVAVMVAHTPNWFAIDSDSGAASFIKTDVPDRIKLDPEITVDNETETLWYLDTGNPARSQYSVLKSTTFGDTWEMVNENLVNEVTPPDVFSIGSLDVPILIAPNGNLAVVTTLEGNGSIAPVGTIHPDSADRIGYFLSTNAGTSWAWNTLGRDGDMVVVGSDTIYPLFENFGQVSGVWDSQNKLHVVTNGYSKAINDTDFVTVFSTLYWRTGLTGWKMMSRPEDLYNPLYETYKRNGNALGFCYPTVAIDPTGSAVFSAWSQPRITGAVQDTASNGYIRYDVWYNSSADNGVTWGTAQKLANSGDGLFTYANRHLGAGASGSLKRAYVVYLADTAAGSRVFGHPGAIGAQVDWIYRWIDFNPGGVSVGELGVIPTDFTLEQNYPNPFNPTTKIEYSISKDVLVSLKVYNILGQEVASLVNQKQTPGNYVVNFDASKLSSGVYIYTLKAGTFTTSKKMILMK
ncbi:MAG: T9SS type A sorting domain-containing protein [Bacteroidota bacterium]|nr:T9SS type A sorting domain-containing protein [Bacteroidota bacterium]